MIACGPFKLVGKSYWKHSGICDKNVYNKGESGEAELKRTEEWEEESSRGEDG